MTKSISFKQNTIASGVLGFLFGLTISIVFIPELWLLSSACFIIIAMGIRMLLNSNWNRRNSINFKKREIIN
ncbi:hypothetical protein DID75_05060 [Candidatus Marinamargulisbacteria bacterium SCGC AG-410-N11]|nr:hypothetical protein DID75_05060 [Candidatus Marinamargulisbacteria bacterium SCGC AG-410-N11]